MYIYGEIPFTSDVFAIRGIPQGMEAILGKAVVIFGGHPRQMHYEC